MRRVCLLLWGVWGAGLGASRAHAELYTVERPLEDEADLLALRDEGRLPEEEAEALRELLRTGVSLRTASREALYALPGLTWAQVDALIAFRRTRPEGFPARALVEAGVLSAEGLRQVRPFLVDEAPRASGTSGRLRVGSAYALADAEVPPLLLQARGQGPWGLSAGLTLALTRRRLAGVRSVPGRRALMATPPGVGLRPPRFHVRWDSPGASVLVGAFRVGFGQRLTLDTTGRPAPDGFLADENVSWPGAPERRCLLSGTEACGPEAARITPDFGWTEGFRGMAATVRARGGAVSLSFTGFGSYQSRSLAPSELFDRTRCASARECAAPEVLVGPTGRARFVSRTLPDVFRELAGGGHAAVGFSPRARLGLTAWGARPVWTLEGLTPDFRVASRFPAGGGYGAVGLDGAWGLGLVDVFVEGARSLTAAGGGWGALQRVVVGDRARQWEGSLRYYGRGFDNPHARPLASADEWEGSRARDERGARLRYLHRTDDEAWRWVGQVDVWTQAEGAPRVVNLAGSLRVEALALAAWRPSVWVEHHNKDLGRNGAGLCFEGARDECSGERHVVGGRLRFEPDPSWSVAAQYQQAWVGHAKSPGGLRRQGQAWGEVGARPVPALRLSGRVGWRNDALAEDTARPTEALRTVLQGAWSLASGARVGARYELVLARAAASQHLFRLELEGAVP
ncbi:hypothetical protein [Archangium primigenium]|uniref:hypothetical protein n=1 Tax=[Archangium] primigenium TaxID=2792470 RepID=UPI00195D3CE0|nr:hypothetical protein [Archangium primigenium]MBM7119461.1 hypothetical protein [Archangium primigenium]